MIYLVTAAGVILLIAAVQLYLHLLQRKLKQERIKKAIGRIPDDTPEFDSVECLLEALGEDRNAVDSITWNDLEMDQIFTRINSCITSAGEELLYAQMHLCRDDYAEKTLEISELIHDDKELHKKILSALCESGITNYNGAAAFAAGIKPPFPEKLILYRIAPLLFPAALIMLLIYPPLSIALLLAGLIFNMFLYYRAHKKHIELFGSLAYINEIAKAAKELTDIPEICTVFPKLRAHAVSMKKFSQAVNLMSPAAAGDDMMAAAYEFIKIMTQVEVLCGAKALQLIEKDGNFAAVYEAVGLCDAACAVENLRITLPKICRPEFISEMALDVRGLYHPLISAPVPNTVKLGSHTLITGSNASGKSSFIKACGVNCILARSLRLCSAESFSMPPLKTVTSMAVTDSTIDGDSYFMAELKSMRRLTAEPDGIICFIDEILKGTNTAERIAASAGVLEYLGRADCLCVCATHDTELTVMLADRYHNRHFTETVTEGRVVFDYLIRDGAAVTRNAIRLMEQMEFPEEITKRAVSLAEGSK